MTRADFSSSVASQARQQPRPALSSRPRHQPPPEGGRPRSGDGNWPRRATPELDAKEADEVLRRKYGFKTTVLLNPTRYDILRALNEARKELTEKDNLISASTFLRGTSSRLWTAVAGSTLCLPKLS